MKVLLMADAFVGAAITKYLVNNFQNDLYQVILTKKGELFSYLENRGVSVKLFISEEEALKNLNSRNIQLGILAWWPFVLKSELINYPEIGFINTHPSFLPYNRGKHFSFWSIVEQAPFGVSIHFVNNKIDAGDIIVQKKISYDWEDDGESLYQKAQEEMIDLFVKNYPLFRQGKFNRIPQNPSSKGSYHSSSEIEQASKIDLDKSCISRDLLNKLRAKTFKGYPGCWFEDNGIVYNVTVKITKKEKEDDTDQK